MTIFRPLSLADTLRWPSRKRVVMLASVSLGLFANDAAADQTIAFRGGIRETLHVMVWPKDSRFAQRLGGDRTESKDVQSSDLGWTVKLIEQSIWAISRGQRVRCLMGSLKYQPFTPKDPQTQEQWGCQYSQVDDTYSINIYGIMTQPIHYCCNTNASSDITIKMQQQSKISINISFTGDEDTCELLNFTEKMSTNQKSYISQVWDNALEKWRPYIWGLDSLYQKNLISGSCDIK